MRRLLTAKLQRLYPIPEKWRARNFYGFYLPAERGLGARSEWGPLGFDFGKAGLLRRDLAALGMTDARLGDLPLCADLPDLGGFAQALGCLYVLEGATLGGQIIARHVEKQLRLHEADGCAFFRSYGGDVGAMWKSFGRFVTAHASAPDIQDTVIRSACDTFLKLGRWLEEGIGESERAANTARTAG